MRNINFIPDDYIKSGESRRTNLIYLVLFVVVMTGVVSSFITIKIRQHFSTAREKVINMKMTQEKENIRRLEILQDRRNAMWKTALTTAELLEPVSRSVLLALLTNNLPRGTSLVQVKLIQKEPEKIKSSSKYKAAQTKQTTKGQPSLSREKRLETHIYIEGIAPSDLQVAAYIKQLSASGGLVDDVSLVESKEFKIKKSSQMLSNASDGQADMTFRQFKLTAVLRKATRPTIEDIERIAGWRI